MTATNWLLAGLALIFIICIFACAVVAVRSQSELNDFERNLRQPFSPYSHTGHVAHLQQQAQQEFDDRPRLKLSPARAFKPSAHHSNRPQP